ncbi:hypothetical protein [Helicobacter sp. MIT 14-3879]|uniref:hypothetical protein n=1 Tax=Helicobacter sp. MIT 14-3879 TaxID=2040649 RepID=UPI0015F13F73|nr:hypothetical protein [Helicobacter sp. MIT 14-3879]
MRDFIYPTLIFIIFLYAMGFVAFYTYKGAASYAGGKKGSVTTVENFQSEINKKIK